MRAELLLRQGIWPQINPPVTYTWLVWVLAVFLILLGVAGPLTLWLVERRRARRAGAYSLESVRVEALAALSEVLASHDRGHLDDSEAALRIGEITKEFAGTATDTEVEALTLSELEDRALLEPALQPLARLVAELYPMVYAGRPGPQVATLAEQAREVVSRWS